MHRHSNILLRGTSAAASIAGIAGLALVGFDWLIFPLLDLGQSLWRLVGVVVGLGLIYMGGYLERRVRRPGVEVANASKEHTE
jgi:hypothetical protein